MVQHTHQYIARRDLRRRIAAGEVDLESLGIKNLTVPPAYIKALPQRKWHEPSPTPLFSSSSKESMQKATPINSLYNQTNCSICLEDYVASTSNIRELPCQHIYHLECIDPFLSKRSSLCPLCKQSVLPKGYIPPKSVLTIATVMRERRRRRAGVRGAGVTQSSSADLELQAITDSTNRSSNQVSTPVNDTVIEETNNHQPSAGRRIWTSLFPGRGWSSSPSNFKWIGICFNDPVIGVRSSRSCCSSSTQLLLLNWSHWLLISGSIQCWSILLSCGSC